LSLFTGDLTALTPAFSLSLGSTFAIALIEGFATRWHREPGGSPSRSC
jgi:hypothetical protein